MAAIKSGASTDILTIDPTSKAARVSPYASDGTYVGEKATYRAATATLLAAPTSVAPFFVIYGSGSKTLRVHRISISGMTLTAVQYMQLNVAKYSTQPSGGTATDLVQVPMDANDAGGTANLVKFYSAAPTAGTKIGDLASRRYLAQAGTAAAGGIPDEITFDFRGQGGETSPIVLRGTTQGIGIYFGVSPASAISFSLEVEWSEE